LPRKGHQIKEAIAFGTKVIKLNESGQGLTEYALILAFIAIACVVAVTTFGGSLTGYLQNIANTVAGV
jgi:Flp pilus assembly pilin Flp